jgi:hypothetical protein
MSGCKRDSKTYGPPRLQVAFEDSSWSVCVNVSGIRLIAVAKMEIRAPWSS